MPAALGSACLAGSAAWPPRLSRKPPGCPPLLLPPPQASLNVQIMAHYVSGASVTALFSHRRVSPASETKPGKPPRGVEYLGAPAAAMPAAAIPTELLLLLLCCCSLTVPLCALPAAWAPAPPSFPPVSHPPRPQAWLAATAWSSTPAAPACSRSCACRRPRCATTALWSCAQTWSVRACTCCRRQRCGRWLMPGRRSSTWRWARRVWWWWGLRARCGVGGTGLRCTRHWVGAVQGTGSSNRT
jgi:hypothetical protein